MQHSTFSLFTHSFFVSVCDSVIAIRVWFVFQPCTLQCLDWLDPRCESIIYSEFNFPCGHNPISFVSCTRLKCDPAIVDSIFRVAMCVLVLFCLWLACVEQPNITVRSQIGRKKHSTIIRNANTQTLTWNGLHLNQFRFWPSEFERVRPWLANHCVPVCAV